MKKPVENEKFNRFLDVIQRMYVHIPMLDTMQVLTYARYLKDILNQKQSIRETGGLLFVERCSAAILDGLLDEMDDPGVPTTSCLIGTQKFDQALCGLRASVDKFSSRPKSSGMETVLLTDLKCDALAGRIN
jgi:hypothetical protein